MNDRNKYIENLSKITLIAENNKNFDFSKNINDFIINTTHEFTKFQIKPQDIQFLNSFYNILFNHYYQLKNHTSKDKETIESFCLLLKPEQNETNPLGKYLKKQLFNNSYIFNQLKSDFLGAIICNYSTNFIYNNSIYRPFPLERNQQHHLKILKSLIKTNPKINNEQFNYLLKNIKKFKEETIKDDYFDFYENYEKSITQYYLKTRYQGNTIKKKKML